MNSDKIYDIRRSLMNITKDDKKLAELIEKTVRRVLKEELEIFLMELNSKLIPNVSDEEQQDIEKIYGKKPKSAEYVKEEKFKI
mgnify:CR=1 FL=1